MYSTEGIILKKDPYGEADAMITILTKDFGKIRLMAQGVRKQEAKLKGHLEPLTHTAISFVVGKNFYRLTSADITDFFPLLKSDIRSLHIATYASCLIDGSAFEEKGDPRLFKNMAELFQKLDAPIEDPSYYTRVLFEFHTQFLDIMGLLPDTQPKERELRVILANNVWGSLRAPFKNGLHFDIIGLV